MEEKTVKKTVIRISLVLLSAALITAGIVTGETDTVMGKAVRICMECIGIG